VDGRDQFGEEVNMTTTTNEMLHDLFSVEDEGLGGYLGWFYDEAGTLRSTRISEGEYRAAMRSFREDSDSPVTIAR
jgi:hypothetical protein